MKNKMGKKTSSCSRLNALLLCFVALAMLGSSRANAFMCNPTPPISISIPPMVFDGGADGPTIGQPISSGWGGSMVSPNFITGDDTCLIKTGIALLMYSAGGSTPVSTYTEEGVTYSVFATNVPSIGIIIGIKALSATNYTPVTSLTLFPPNPVPSRGMGIAVYTKFIVIGRLTSGVYHIAEQPLIRVYANGSEANSPTDFSELIFKATTITITAKTCQMSGGTTRNVPLLPVGKSQFSGVGTSAGAGYNFSLTTICNSGVKLYATMTDGTDPANTGNILTMGSGASASGVGVQILRNDTPISFGPDSSASGNTNQWYIGTAGSMDNEPFTIPLKARYIQTAPTMVAGSVKARATVTFSYQ